MADLKKDFMKDVKKIQEEMDLLFDHFFRISHSPVLTTKRLWRPPTDVFESEEEVIIFVEIAGMKQNDFTITLTENILTLKGERKELPLGSRTYYRNMEINYGPFERNIYLPEDIDSQGIKALYENGCLKIRISKMKGKRGKSKEIQIESEGKEK
jgi:HSP20 family protein